MNTLTQPISLGHLTLSNRLVLPPMASAKADENGRVTPELLDYYDRISRGGHIGLVILEHAFVHPSGRASARQLSLSSDGDIDGLSRLVSLLQKNGSRVFAQLNHAGAYAESDDVMSASSGLMPRDPEVRPRAMTGDDIALVTDSFALAARRAKAAGCDGVEIHSAHGYLLNQFWSPLSNRRTDGYTGSTVAGRLRLHRETIAAVRAAVGADYPIALRLGGCDYAPGGSTIGDSVEAARILAGEGLCLLDISGGHSGYRHPGSAVPGYFRDMTAPIRQAVDIPVMLTGGITDPHDAQSLLDDGAADLIGVGRAMLRDDRWAEKAMAALA